MVMTMDMIVHIIVPAIHVAKGIELPEGKFLEWSTVNSWNEFQIKLKQNLVPDLVVDMSPITATTLETLKNHIADRLSQEQRSIFVQRVTFYQQWQQLYEEAEASLQAKAHAGQNPAIWKY